MSLSGSRPVTGSESVVIGRVIREIDRALDLARAGKIGKTPRDWRTSNVEAAALLSEEISEAQDEAFMLIFALRALNTAQLKVLKSVNDLEEVLFRASAGNVDELDKNFIHQTRDRLTEELTQVAGVAINWLVRIHEDQHGTT